MRKVIVLSFVSLDGVIQAPGEQAQSQPEAYENIHARSGSSNHEFVYD